MPLRYTDRQTEGRFSGVGWRALVSSQREIARNTAKEIWWAGL